MTALIVHQNYLNDILDRQKERRLKIDPSSKHVFPIQPQLSHLSTTNSINKDHDPNTTSTDIKVNDEVEGMKVEEVLSKDNVINYIKEEETIRNDYSNWFGKSNDYSSDWILGAKDQEICEEYPALKKLMSLKTLLTSQYTHPPLYLPLTSVSPLSIQSSLGLNNKFDVILINPLSSSWETTSNLPIRQISSDPSFVFLWVGKGDDAGLERGRECFAKWGFRRAEDIVWVKTNKSLDEETDVKVEEQSHQGNDSDSQSQNQGATKKRKRGNGNVENGSLFASQKEHCLMGIRGTVRRSTDMRFVHCNVDTDVMVWEGGDEPDSPSFPPYLYTLIENFCLGTRRLELLPTSPKPRKGWVTASLAPMPTTSSMHEEVLQFDPTTYPSMIPESDGRPVLPYHTEIDTLRPKSPQRRPRNLPGSGITPNNTGGRPSPNPSTGFRPPNPNSNYNNNQSRQFNQRQQQQNPNIQGYNSYNGNNQMNPMLMNQMSMMNMNMGMGGMNMMPFGNNFNQQGLGYNGMNPMNMGINGGQPGTFNQMPMGMQMPMQVGMGGMPMQMQMSMPMGMGMGMMPFNNGGMGFDQMNMMGMGGFDNQGQGGGGNQNQGQDQGQSGMGMNWQGNWQ